MLLYRSCDPLKEFIGAAQAFTHDFHHFQAESRILPHQEFKPGSINLGENALANADDGGAPGLRVDEGHFTYDRAGFGGFDKHIIHQDFGFALEEDEKVDSRIAAGEKGRTCRNYFLGRFVLEEG